jgi:hypothetical protein
MCLLKVEQMRDSMLQISTMMSLILTSMVLPMYTMRHYYRLRLTSETPYFITLIQSDFCASRRTPDALTYSENHVRARGRRHKRSREDGPKM